MNNSAKGHNTKKDFQEMETYLNERFDFRYNTVLGVVEFKEKVEVEGLPNQSMRLDDYNINSIHRDLKWEDITVTRQELVQTLYSSYTRIFDPFRNYFDSLGIWNGVDDNIQQLADTITVSDGDKPLWNMYLKKWLIGCVACALDEKLTNQSVLVLIGGQGIGKTTWMERLMPNKIKKYYFSGTIDPNNKDTQINLAECFLINLDELENLNRGELGSLKQLITQSSIRIRRPYATLAENMPRRASLMGSVNNPEFLKDDTGNRRFLCVEALKIDHKHKVNMDSVFAQAYQLYQEGYRYWFEGEENNLITQYNQQFKVQQIELELVNQYYQPCLPDEKPDFELTISDLQKQLKRKGQDKNDLSLRKLGIAMKASKYQRTKRDGVWYYKLMSKQKL